MKAEWNPLAPQRPTLLCLHFLILSQCQKPRGKFHSGPKRLADWETYSPSSSKAARYLDHVLFLLIPAVTTAGTTNQPSRFICATPVSETDRLPMYMPACKECGRCPAETELSRQIRSRTKVTSLSSLCLSWGLPTTCPLRLLLGDPFAPDMLHSQCCYLTKSYYSCFREQVFLFFLSLFIF